MATARSSALLFVCVLLCVAPRGADAQSRDIIEPYLDADHWSRNALHRLAGLGLIDAGTALDAWPLRRSEVRSLFVTAVATADEASRDNAYHVAIAMLSAFEQEYPRPVATGPAALARFGTGLTGRSGALLGGTSEQSESGRWIYPGPVAGPAPEGVRAGGEFDLFWRSLTASAALRHIDEVVFDAAYVSLAVGPLDVWAGRRSLSFSAAHHGAVVLSPARALDGLGLQSSAFRVLGMRVRGALFLSRLERSGEVEHPWFSAARVSVSPGSGFTIGLNRATIFGGEGNVQPLTARNFAFMLIGLTSQLGKDSGFENQVASMDIWSRFWPGGVPVVAYGELGIDDVGFSMFKTAAFIAGLELPSVPGVAALSLGIEHANFPGSCCGHPPWYRHGALGDGWTDGGFLLAHPLGGHGREWSIVWNVATPAAQLGGRAFTRERGTENLFAPDRAGSSTGGSFSATLPFGRVLLMRASLSGERGDGWTAWSGDLGVHFLVGASGGTPTDSSPARGQRGKLKDMES